MYENVEFLNNIHQNAEMGKVTTNQVIQISQEEEHKNMLWSQLQEYKIMYAKTSSMK